MLSWLASRIRKTQRQLLGDSCPVVAGAWCEAIVACVAPRGGLLSEIGKECVPPASGGFRVGEHLAQLSPSDPLFLRR